MSDQEHVYFNILITNNTNNAIPASFAETHPSPILNKTEDYELTTMRFKIPLMMIPLFTFTNDFVVRMVMMDDADNIVANSGAVTVDWRETQEPPTVGDERLVYYYQQFIDMTNDALKIAFEQLVAQVAAIAPPIKALDDVANNPVITYDPVTKLFNLVLPILNSGNTNPNAESVFDPDNDIYAPRRYVAIIFNNHLFTFFNGFPSIRIENPVGSAIYNYQIGVQNYYGTKKPANYFNDTTLADLEGYLVIPASYPVLTSWQTLSRIMFLTTMPIYSEHISNNLPNNIGKNLTQNLLTDYEVPSSEGNFREYLYYFNETNYRFVNFACNGVLRNIQINIMYMDAALNMRQLYIPVNSEVNIKLLFRKKKLRLLKELYDKRDIEQKLLAK